MLLCIRENKSNKVLKDLDRAKRMFQNILMLHNYLKNLISPAGGDLLGERVYTTAGAAQQRYDGKTVKKKKKKKMSSVYETVATVRSVHASVFIL